MEPRDEWRNPDTEALFAAVLTLEDSDEVARFFRDLLTYNELNELGQRWAIVRKLEKGVPYRQIAEEIGVSTATITRVNQWRQHGMSGYRLVLDRLAGKSSS
ncbi:MAG: YerC/YecD family TrpR-related protein [Acidimicrobiia bacterium]|nr:YerC/YecD family TrpR-related protein [Acidimicrobiia bacterium]